MQEECSSVVITRSTYATAMMQQKVSPDRLLAEEAEEGSWERLQARLREIAREHES